jgi:hypothetical protein
MHREVRVWEIFVGLSLGLSASVSAELAKVVAGCFRRNNDVSRVLRCKFPTLSSTLWVLAASSSRDVVVDLNDRLGVWGRLCLQRPRQPR